MIRHVYHDGSVGHEYEVGDLVRRTRDGLIARAGEWGRVYSVEPFNSESRKRTNWYYTATFWVRVSGYSRTDTDIPNTHGGAHDFEPFELPEKNLFWESLTDKDRVFEIRRAGGSCTYLAVRPDGSEGVVCWGGSEAFQAQGWLARRARRIDVPAPVDVFPFVAEVMEA